MSSSSDSSTRDPIDRLRDQIKQLEADLSEAIRGLNCKSSIIGILCSSLHECHGMSSASSAASDAGYCLNCEDDKDECGSDCDNDDDDDDDDEQ